MTSMRLTTLLRNSLPCAAKSARIIGTQEYLQSMILTALARGARGHSGRKSHLLNSGTTKIYKNIFRIPENLNHYSEKDYRAAERKFLKQALEQRKIETEEELLRK